MRSCNLHYARLKHGTNIRSYTRAHRWTLPHGPWTVTSLRLRRFFRLTAAFREGEREMGHQRNGFAERERERDYSANGLTFTLSGTWHRQPEKCAQFPCNKLKKHEGKRVTAVRDSSDTWFKTACVRVKLLNVTAWAIRAGWRAIRALTLDRTRLIFLRDGKKGECATPAQNIARNLCATTRTKWIFSRKIGPLPLSSFSKSLFRCRSSPPACSQQR